MTETSIVSRVVPSYLHLDMLYCLNLKSLQYHHLPRQVVTPYKPQDDSEHLALGKSVSDASSDRAPLLMGTEPTKLPLPIGKLVLVGNQIHEMLISVRVKISSTFKIIYLF